MVHSILGRAARFYRFSRRDLAGIRSSRTGFVGAVVQGSEIRTGGPRLVSGFGFAASAGIVCKQVGIEPDFALLPADVRRTPEKTETPRDLARRLASVSRSRPAGQRVAEKDEALGHCFCSSPFLIPSSRWAGAFLHHDGDVMDRSPPSCLRTDSGPQHRVLYRRERGSRRRAAGGDAVVVINHVVRLHLAVIVSARFWRYEYGYLASGVNCAGKAGPGYRSYFRVWPAGFLWDSWASFLFPMWWDLPLY